MTAASFDTLHTHRSTWKLARQLLEQKDVYEWLAEICKEFCLACFESGDGKFTLQKIDATADAVTTYGDSSILMADSMKADTFRLERGALDYVFTEFTLKYKINMATGEPEKTLFVKTPEAGSYDASYTNLTSSQSTYWGKCQTAYTNYIQHNLWEYTANWIRDDATAELFLKFMITLLTRRPYIASFTSSLSMIALDLLDEVKIAHPLLPAAIDSTSRFRLTSQTLDPMKCTIQNTFTEVI
jgi:hypothetical protein